VFSETASSRRPHSFRFILLRLDPAALMVASYLLAMTIGTILLMMPWASRATRISLVDALFTITSALCVTGLTVVDTGSTFTAGGQFVILTAIQLGGLGIMTFAVFILLAAGWHISTQQRFFIQESYAPDLMRDVRRLVYFVFLYTVLVELGGATLLFLCWKGDLSVSQKMYYSVFHSISAYCNAGFGLYSDSLVRYYDHTLLNLTIVSLIILGGLGFPVAFELVAWVQMPRRSQFSLHSRLVLLTTGVLILLGMIAFWTIEHDRYMQGMSLKAQLLVSLFQSVTPRTAGFATVDFNQLCNATLLIVILLMFIGGSPGSCAGGIKTTSMATLLVVLWNMFRGSDVHNVMKSTLSQTTVSRTIAIFVASVCLVVLILCPLLMVQQAAEPEAQAHGHFLEFLFETVSAFGTVGLSMGASANLNDAGKLLITAMMFIGRVGILTLVHLFTSRQTEPAYRFAEENVMIG
jgi:trk/ktr system potassium uptake protein